MFFFFRNSLGRNDNPNADQFRAAFKKLLICHPLTTSVGQNTISNATKILTVSSRRKKKSPALVSQMHVPEVEFEFELGYEALILEQIEEMDSFSQHLCAYLASCVETNIHKDIKCFKYKCTKCAGVLFTANDKINDELLAMKQSEQPSISTMKLVIFANAIMGKYSPENYQGNNFNFIWKMICENVDFDDLYEDFDVLHNEEDESLTRMHKVEFVSQVIKVYLTMKFKQICKKQTDIQRGEIIRFRNKHNYKEAGQ